MHHRLRVLVNSCLLLAVSTAGAADRCALMSKGDAAALLGQPVVSVVPSGPEPDEDSGGQISFCTYRGASLAIVVSVVEFKGEAQARQQLSINLVRDRMDAPDAKVTDEPGLGEKAFFGTTANAAMVTFLKKNKVVGIGIGGAKAPTTKAPLRASALAIAAKL